MTEYTIKNRRHNVIVAKAKAGDCKNALVSRLNALLPRLNALVSRLNALIPRLNALVYRLNALLPRLNALVCRLNEIAFYFFVSQCRKRGSVCLNDFN